VNKFWFAIDSGCNCKKGEWGEFIGSIEDVNWVGKVGGDLKDGIGHAGSIMYLASGG
jgi:hypothetical protein